MAAVVLVLAKRLGEIILALVGDARDVVLAGKIRVVTAVAAVLLRDRQGARHPRGVAGLRRHRFRQFRDEVGKGAEVFVGQRFCHVVHRLEYAQFLTEHEQLDQRIGRLLRAERGRVFRARLALLAMAGEARRHPFLEGLGCGGRGKENERHAAGPVDGHSDLSGSPSEIPTASVYCR